MYTNSAAQATKQKVVAQKAYVHIHNLKCVSVYKYITQHLFLLVYLDHPNICSIYCFYQYSLVLLYICFPSVKVRNVFVQLRRE